RGGNGPGGARRTTDRSWRRTPGRTPPLARLSDVSSRSWLQRGLRAPEQLSTKDRRRCIMLYLNCFKSGGCLVESEPNGDTSIPLKLGGQPTATVAALLEIESFRLSEALAAIYLAGVIAGRRAVQVAAPAVPSEPVVLRTARGT